MLASAIRVHAGFEANIRTVVVTDDGAGVVLEKLGGGQSFVFGVPIQIPFQLNLFEAVSRIASRATTGDGIRFAVHDQKVNRKLVQRKVTEIFFTPSSTFWLRCLDSRR